MNVRLQGLDVGVTRSSQDTWRGVTLLAFAGVVAAAALAILGLPPVDTHGPWHHAGFMSPTCGGTRAARLFVRGDVAGAWAYTPWGSWQSWAPLPS